MTHGAPTAAEPAQRSAVTGLAAALMVGMTFVWGLNHVAVKVSTEGYHPIVLTTVRSALGGILVLLWCQARGIRLFERDGSLGPGLLAGGLFGLEFIIIFFGVSLTTAGRASLLVNMMPFWVLIGSHIFLGDRVSGGKVVGLCLAFAGVAVVVTGGRVGEGSLAGDLLCLAGGVLWAASTLVIKGSRLRLVSGEKTLIYQLAVSTVMTAPLILLLGSAVTAPTAAATGALLFQAVVVVGITYVVWFQMMRTYPATGLASFAFLSPVFGVLCGALLLGEPLTVRVLLALALIAAGLTLVNRPARSRIPPA